MPTDGSFLPNCTFYTPQYSLPARKSAVWLKTIAQYTSSNIPASSRYFAGWGNLRETSAWWTIWKIWNTFETWNVRKGCFTSWIHNAPFMWREICHIEMKCTPFECTVAPQSTAIDRESSSTFPNIYHDILVTACPPWTIIKVFFSTEIWLAWLKHDGLAKIRSTPCHSDMCGGKKSFIKVHFQKRVRERFIFHTDTGNLLKGVFKQSLFITEFYKSSQSCAMFVYSWWEFPFGWVPVFYRHSQHCKPIAFLNYLIYGTCRFF